MVHGQVVITVPPVPMLPSGVPTERRRGQRRRSLPAEAVAELLPPEGERRHGERRKRG